MNPKPNIITKQLPGPNARKIIERDGELLASGNWRYLPFVPSRGKDVWIEDVDGNTFLDFVSGAAVMNLGIGDETVEKSIREQLEQFSYSAIPGYYYHELVNDLCHEIIGVTPNFAKSKKVFLGLSGADTADTAMKLARFHTKRWRFISFIGCNHGLGSYGSVSLQGLSSQMVAGFGPLVPGTLQIPYPYRYRPALHASSQEEDENSILDYLEEYIFKTVAPAGEFAGIFVEPMQGDGGVLMPTPSFFRRLSKIARENGILTIVDEVQTGFGRTGKMFGIEHFDNDLIPDMILLAKPLGGGLPMSAVVGRSDFMDLPRGSHAMTAAGHLPGCAAALATIREIKSRNLVENSARVGDFMLSKLERYKESSSRGSTIVGDVRGKGLLVGVEVVKDRKTKKPGNEEIRKVNYEAFSRGLLTAYDGLNGNVFRLMPSLTLSEELAGLGCDILMESFDACVR